MMRAFLRISLVSGAIAFCLIAVSKRSVNLRQWMVQKFRKRWTVYLSNGMAFGASLYRMEILEIAYAIFICESRLKINRQVSNCEV